MKGTINLVVAGICLVEIVYHFIKQPESETLLNQKVSNPIYLSVWGIGLVWSLIRFYRINKTRKPH